MLGGMFALIATKIWLLLLLLFQSCPLRQCLLLRLVPTNFSSGFSLTTSFSLQRRCLLLLLLQLFLLLPSVIGGFCPQLLLLVVVVIDVVLLLLRPKVSILLLLMLSCFPM
jgi:hypothetical protein